MARREHHGHGGALPPVRSLTVDRNGRVIALFEGFEQQRSGGWHTATLERATLAVHAFAGEPAAIPFFDSSGRLLVGTPPSGAAEPR